MYEPPLPKVMKKTLLPLIAAAVLSACGGSPQAPVAAEVQGVARTEREVVVAGEPVTLADMSVEGMTCEMMCGGAIKKALAKIPGVASTEIRFTEDESPDHAIVTFDPAQVSDAELVKAVQAIHEGQYKVSSVVVTHQVKGDAPEDGGEPEDAAAKEGSEVSAALPELVMPSLFGLLARLLRI
jgi:copper chaperone CopZ